MGSNPKRYTIFQSWVQTPISASDQCKVKIVQVAKSKVQVAKDKVQSASDQ